MDKIYQCAIYKKGYKKPEMTRAFYFGMNLDSVYNYTGNILLLDEEELYESVEVEISNINNDEVEIKKVNGYRFLTDKIDNDIVAIPIRIYEVKKVNYVWPFLT